MIKKLLKVAAFLFGIFIAGLVGFMVIIYAGDYVIDEEDLVMSSTTSIVSEDGDLVTKLYFQNRNPIRIKKIPKHVQQAFIAVEDSRFYDHHGIDFQAILRALYIDILAGEKAQGGSTITQQLAKDIFLSHDKTWLRKTKEAIIAINLERNYSKKKILEMYLNQIYFGHGAYGIQSAAKRYFSKPVSELTVAEGAMLAALPKAPGTYSPINNPKNTNKRRDLILSLMTEQNFISAQKAVEAQGTTLSLNLHKVEKHREYWTYIDMVLQEAKQKYNLSNVAVFRGGYKIVVPMSEKVQKVSYRMFQDESYFPGSDPEHPPQGAFVLMNPETGGVLAVQGGRHYVKKGINRVTVKQQPGSTFKPLVVYGPALEKEKYKPYSLLKDKKMSYKAFRNDGEPYTPENQSGNYRGTITMYDAITVSANAPAVWLLDKIGIDTGKKYLKKMDINIPDKGLAMALGGLKQGVTPLEMVKAYRAFHQEGEIVEPYFITKIYNRDGELIGKADPEEKQIFSPQTAWYMTKMLESVIEKGTGERGEVATALAGKTGSTGYPAIKGAIADAWFVGYTPKAVGAMWMGYDKTTEEHYLTGGSRYPTMFFKDLLKQLPKQHHLAFAKPDGVKKLPPPIRLAKIEHLKADFTIASFGMPSVKLTWTPFSDDRLVYHIYTVDDEERKKIGTVTGKGQFIDEGINIFSIKNYIVVPYNPQTKREGKSSKKVTIDFIPIF